MKAYLLKLGGMYFWAFNLSCGVNLQQNGYKNGSTFLEILGTTLIAIALLGAFKSNRADPPAANGKEEVK
jgi:hypothetical protein